MVEDVTCQYNNITAGMAISAGATTIIGFGTGMMVNDWKSGLILVLIGICIYFIKGMLMKAGRI